MLIGKALAVSGEGSIVGRRGQRCDADGPDVDLQVTYKGVDGVLYVVQLCRPGDKGLDDTLGEVTICSMEGGDLAVEDGTLDDSGKAITKHRTAWHVRALWSSRKHSPSGRAQRSGRGSARRHNRIPWYFDSTASGSPVVHGQRPASNAKAFGGKAPKPAAKPAEKPAAKPVATPAANAHGKRKEHEVWW